MGPWATVQPWVPGRLTGLIAPCPGRDDLGGMKILIAFATTEGQTRKIARYMADEFQVLGHTVTLADVTDEPPPPAGHDAAILGGSIHLGALQEPLAH